MSTLLSNYCAATDFIPVVGRFDMKGILFSHNYHVGTDCHIDSQSGSYDV